MHFNWLLFPTLLGALLFSFVGFQMASVQRSRPLLAACAALAVVLALPSLLFVVYYGHLLDRAGWFYAFRAAPYSDLTAAGLGLGAGLLVGWDYQSIQRRQRLHFRLVVAGMGLLCGAILFVPYIKPLIAPIRRPLHDQWTQGVCLQSSPSTCGPCSAATLLRQFHINVSEADIARECFSYRGGTENWYVARALQRQGLTTRYLMDAPEPEVLPFPAIAGVQMGGARWGGHFITILGRQSNFYVIGDPLIGRLLLTRKQLYSRYYFTGFFLLVARPS